MLVRDRGVIYFAVRGLVFELKQNLEAHQCPEKNSCPPKRVELLWSSVGKIITVELQWLEPLWDHENVFETAVVRATEFYFYNALPGGIMEIIVRYLYGVLYYKCMLCVLIRIASSRRF